MSKEELKQRLSEADESVTWQEFTKWIAMCINASEAAVIGGAVTPDEYGDIRYAQILEWLVQKNKPTELKDDYS